MRTLFWRIFLRIKKDGDHDVIIDPHGDEWIRKDRMENAVAGCDFLLTLRLNHIEDVIAILRNEELVDPCGFALEVLSAHGYSLDGAPS